MLDGQCIVSLTGEQLIVNRGRDLRFRAATGPCLHFKRADQPRRLSCVFSKFTCLYTGGPTLDEWHACILTAARARSRSFAGADESGHAPLP